MGQSSDGFRFPLESGEAIRVLCKLLRKNFDRNFAVQVRVASAIDLAYTAFADRGSDLIRADHTGAETRAAEDSIQR